jgi:transcription elongation factor Elf1
MKASNKEKRQKDKVFDKYLTCPRCGARVPYHRRVIHSCFRAHLKEMEMEIARMGWGSRAG